MRRYRRLADRSPPNPATTAAKGRRTPAPSARCVRASRPGGAAGQVPSLSVRRDAASQALSAVGHHLDPSRVGDARSLVEAGMEEEAVRLVVDDLLARRAFIRRTGSRPASRRTIRPGEGSRRIAAVVRRNHLVVTRCGSRATPRSAEPHPGRVALRHARPTTTGRCGSISRMIADRGFAPTNCTTGSPPTKSARVGMLMTP